MYEPLVHVVDGIAQRTSRAADPELSRSGAGAFYHVDCSVPDAPDTTSLT